MDENSFDQGAESESGDSPRTCLSKLALALENGSWSHNAPRNLGWRLPTDFMAIENIVRARKRFHHGGETEGGCGENDDLADFGGSAFGFDRAPGMAMNRAFKLAADRNGEFDEGARFGIERAGFGGGISERVVSRKDRGEIFLEAHEATGKLAGRRRFGTFHIRARGLRSDCDNASNW